MNQFLFRKTPALAMLVIGLGFLASFAPTVRCQEPELRPAREQRAAVDDPIPQLFLTAEQREKIRAIMQANRDERMAINRRVERAQLALEETLDSDSPSEAVVEQRIRDLVEAQAAQIRMRALTELQIRSLLTPEQIRKWRDLRLQARRDRARRRLENAGGDPRIETPGQRRFPNQGNGIGPQNTPTPRGPLPRRRP